ncbi:MAG: hypothetical protein M5R36_15475 [Deltaproteobacteria bacterium]|nr:hypothetical protein [Deltaproteobacteria bacterium]
MSDGRIDYRTRLFVALLLSVAAMLAYHTIQQIDLPHAQLRANSHIEILNGTAPAPYRHRVLAPYSAAGLMAVLTPILGSKERAFLVAYGMFDAAALAFSLLAIFFYIKRFFAEEHAFIATLFAAATHVVALRDYYYQPWSLPEAGLVALGLMLILDRRTIAFALLTAAATLNRETGVLLPLCFLAAHADEPKKHAAPIVAVFAVWAVVFGGLRLALGGGDMLHGLAELWNTNISNLGRAVLNLSLFWARSGRSCRKDTGEALGLFAASPSSRRSTSR